MTSLSFLTILPGLRRVAGGRLRCSFCRRSEDEVARLVAGASAHICDACIGKCVSVLEAHGGFDPPGAAAI